MTMMTGKYKGFHIIREQNNYGKNIHTVFLKYIPVVRFNTDNVNERKLAAIDLVGKGLCTQNTAGKICGFHRNTVFKLIRTKRLLGIEAVIEDNRGLKSAYKYIGEVRSHIKKLLRKYPDWTDQAIAEQAAEDVKMEVSRSAVARIRTEKLDRKKDYNEYIETVKRNAREIREKVLKYLMVRRTRTEVEKYFSQDIKKQGLKFPEVKKPKPFYYELNDAEDQIFNQTIDLIANQFTYARYMPLLYYEGKIDQLEEQSQKNMGRFMKILLVKRLESSFFAFRNSVDRFLHSYEMFIKEFDAGNVYVSKKHTNKIFELLENDDDEAIQRLIDAGKAQKY